MTSVYGILFFSALITALCATPLARHLGLALRVVDAPHIRKVHTGVITRVGGLAILVGFAVGIAVLLLLKNPIGVRLREDPTRLLLLLGPALLVFAVGFVDDLRNILPRAKLLVQLVAALALCVCDLRIDGFRLGPDYTLQLGPLSWVVTVLWVVGITNALNLIDGLDGLAGGIAVLACGAMAVLAIDSNDRMVACCALILGGSVCGFLFFNFNPARIYMGDGGALLIGFLLATMAILVSPDSETSSGQIGTVRSLGIPLLALGVPILDTLHSIVRRVLERRSPFAADKGHVHHRLLDLGFGPRRTVLVLWGITATVGGLSLLMLRYRDVKSLLVFVVALLLLMLAFRIIGALRFRPTWSAFVKKQVQDRAQREVFRSFEDLQLHFREVRDFDSWWQLIERTAREMAFERVVLRTRDREGGWSERSWDASPEHGTGEEAVDQLVQATLPVPQRRPGSECSLRVEARVGASLENVSQRLLLFSRLIDECSVRDLDD